MRSGHFNHQAHARQQAEFFARVEAERVVARREAEMTEATVISKDGHQVTVTARRMKSEFSSVAYWYPVLNGWTNRARHFETREEAIECGKFAAQD